MMARLNNSLDWLVSKFIREVPGWRMFCWCSSIGCRSLSVSIYRVNKPIGWLRSRPGWPAFRPVSRSCLKGGQVLQFVVEMQNYYYYLLLMRVSAGSHLAMLAATSVRYRSDRP